MKLKTKLEKLLKETENHLEKYVIQDILDNGNGTEDTDIKNYISDVLQHGCVSGMVSSLIYYTDTYAFYATYADEIDELKEEMESETGEPLHIESNVRNSLAWFGYEQTLYQIANKLGLND